MIDSYNTYLVVAPHADDETLGVGGTVHKLLELNKCVHLIICSHRSHDCDCDYSPVLDHYKSWYNLGQEDEKIDTVKLIKQLEVVCEDIRPDVVFIPNRDDFNMDHQSVYKACQVVFRRYQPVAPKMILMYETPSSTTQSFNNNFHCNLYISLSYKQIEHKIKTFNHYKLEIRTYPNPRCKDGILTYAKFRGMECNSEYAEGFKIIYCRDD